jgi:hypothetical protein
LKAQEEQQTHVSFYFSSLDYSRDVRIGYFYLPKHTRKREKENGKNTIKNYHSNRGWRAEPTDVISTKLIDSSIQKCCVYKRVVINTSLLEAEQQQQQPALAFITYNFTFVFSLVRQR